MSLTTDTDIAARAHVDVILVLLQEVVSTNQYVSQPLEDLCVVHNLMLDEFLWDREEHLRADIPECINVRLGIPQLDLLWLM